MPAAAILGTLLAGCASVPSEAGKTERMSSEALAASQPQPVAAVSIDDIVALSTGGASADAIVERIRASHSRYRLSATQLLQLRQRGVDVKVLDHIVEAERRAIFEEVAGDIAKRDQACKERITQEVRQCQLLQAPAPWPAQPFANCWPPHPGFPYWRCF